MLHTDRLVAAVTSELDGSWRMTRCRPELVIALPFWCLRQHPRYEAANDLENRGEPI